LGIDNWLEERNPTISRYGVFTIVEIIDNAIWRAFPDRNFKEIER